MVLTDKLRRPSALAVAALLLLMSILPLLSFRKVNAAGLLSSRAIKISSSQLAATNVIYEVTFTTGTTGTVQGVVVDFCQSSPIIGDACTAPTGFDINETTVDVSVSGLNVGTGAYALDAATETNKAVITNANAGSTNASTAVTITFGTAPSTDGVTNPSDNDPNTGGNQAGTFYARILTFSTVAGATGYDSDTANVNNPGAEPPLIDAGGIALSTAQQITITSKVQERLTFCVYTDVDCATGGTSVLLGDTNGVLDDQDEFVDKNTKFDVSTNASGDVAIRVKGNTLINGSFDIAAVGGTPTRTVEGTEQFGFCSYQSSGSGLSIDFKYDGNGNVGGGGTGVCSTGTSQTAGTGTSGGAGDGTGGGVNYIATDPYFAFDLAGINTTYGEQFATKQAGSLSQGTLAFIGNIAPTTEAGIYQTVLTFIATGTY